MNPVGEPANWGCKPCAGGFDDLSIKCAVVEYVLVDAPANALGATMKITKPLWVAMAFIALDSLLRIAVLGFWFTSPESAPNLPVFYKGVKYPELQAGILTFNAVALAALALPTIRSPWAFGVLEKAFVVFGAATLLLSFVYSANVVGSAFIYAMAAVGVRQSAQSLGAQQGTPVDGSVGKPASDS